MKNSLNITGLSLVQAAAVSNLIQQRALDLIATLRNVNNSTKRLSYDGQTLTVQEGKPMPTNVVDALKEIGLLRATQAFLMVNIKAKDQLLKEIQQRRFVFDEAAPDMLPFVGISAKLKPFVDEEWAWNQLSAGEANEFLEQEALASHIGQFIHKGEPLDVLRKDLDNATPLEWMVIGKGTPTAVEKPITVTLHHTKEQLLELHNELAGLHRQYEQRVNYFKAKVKNLVSVTNAEIAKDNAVEQGRVNGINQERNKEYNALVQAWEGRKQVALQEFEKQRELDTNATAALRIDVDKRFQPVVDLYMAILEPKPTAAEPEA
jgi:hypothetical protein